MKRVDLRRAELCAVELLCAQGFHSIFDLGQLDVERLSLPVSVVFCSFSRYAADTGIARAALTEGGAEGLTVRHGGQYLVLFDEGQACAARRRFTLAHELGHILLTHAGVDAEREEREANAFAAALLCPAAALHFLVARDGGWPEADALCAIFPLSREAAVCRLAELRRRKPRPPAPVEIELLLQLFGKLPAKTS